MEYSMAPIITAFYEIAFSYVTIHIVLQINELQRASPFYPLQSQGLFTTLK